MEGNGEALVNVLSKPCRHHVGLVMFTRVMFLYIHGLSIALASGAMWHLVHPTSHNKEKHSCYFYTITRYAYGFASR